jgi:hypothetical protein
MDHDKAEKIILVANNNPVTKGRQLPYSQGNLCFQSSKSLLVNFFMFSFRFLLVFTAVLMSSMIPLTILSLDTDETVWNLSSREYNSAKEICKYPSFSKVGGNYPLDLKIIWSSAFQFWSEQSVMFWLWK